MGNIGIDHAGIYVCSGSLNSGDMNSGTDTINVKCKFILTVYAVIFLIL